MSWLACVSAALRLWGVKINQFCALSFYAEGPISSTASPCALQVDSRDWGLNGNTLSLDEETVIDVPEPYNHVSKYCASLGHKANHSFTPNCIYDM